MAKKKQSQEVENGGAGTEVPEGEEKRLPLKRFTYAVGKDAYVSVSVWDRKVDLEGGESFVTYDTSVQKRIKVNGEWKTIHSFRAGELAYLQHALTAAFAFILETKAQAQKDPVPF